MTAAADPLLRPSPHVVRDDAMPTDRLADLLAFAFAHEADFVGTRVGGGTVLDIRTSRALPRAMFKDWRPWIEDWIGAMLPGIFAELGMTPFPVSRFELQLVAHNDGDFYRPHIDTKIGQHDERSKRLLSMVYYFHAEPKAFEGGALRIFSLVSKSSFADVAPEQNRLVAFPSWVPHEVRPIACPSGRFEDSRFSINCWARSNKPVAAQSPSSRF